MEEVRVFFIHMFTMKTEMLMVVTNRVYVEDYRKLNANLLQMRGVWVLKMLNRLGGGYQMSLSFIVI